MGLFQDDFYSTKPSRGTVRLRQGTGTGGKFLAVVIAASLLTGSGLTLLVTRAFPSSTPAAQPAIAVNAPVDRSDSSTDPVVEAVSQVQAAVVSVITTDVKDDKIQGGGMGSGVIFRKMDGKALIVTNNHVIDTGNTYEIVLADGTRRDGTLVGKDEYTDLAVLSMKDDGIKTVAEFGDSDKLRPGETAIAIGNPLGLSFSHTITKGVISSPLQTIPVFLGKDGDLQWEMEVIQTDAPINQGNSGGALINLAGQVIGINSMKISDTGVEGLGFAIPVNSAKPVLEALISDHKVKRPKMGIFSEDLQAFSSGLDILKLPDGVKSGVIVTDVADPAKGAGLETRDVIVALDGKDVGSTMELRKYLFGKKKIGDKLEVTFYRGGKKEKVSLTLGELD
ncbi:S1C family serine protease [Gorillibacterium timonense]|uniref:S1C family serine protease n=1 Tax=Gorillibacterium timonense TaxID=1689269 RepID=UPI00071D355E|nr:trypsin-like peptidase domain-containing protein [Gorillibacterium timonense]